MKAVEKTNSKISAIDAFINEWLKDKTVYCGNCLQRATPELAVESCCHNPALGRNVDHLMAVIKDNVEIRKTMLKDTGATKDNSLRFGVNIPQQLYQDLEAYFKQYGEKLFNDKKELREFMRKFPSLSIPKKI